MKKRYQHVFMLIGFLLLPLAVLAGDYRKDQADSTRIERLAALGKLWGTIKYFHPYLAYRDLNWDSALVTTIPKVNAATTAEEYAAAVQLMLDKLGDPITRVIRKTQATAASSDERHPISKFTADSVLVVTITNYGDLADFVGAREKLSAVSQQLSKARSVLFDLRSVSPVGDDEAGSLSYIFGTSGLNGMLSANSVSSPGQRARMHVGFAPQSGATSGGYYSAFYVSDGRRFSPVKEARDKPIVFLINDYSELPPIALALQASGKAAIVAEGSASDASVVTIQRMLLSDGVEVAIRLSELIYEDGSTGFHTNQVVPAPVSKNEDQALQAALALARRGEFKAASVASPALVARAVPAAEQAYQEMRYPPVEYRLLAAFRIWTVINYFFPYKDLIGEDWNAVLKSFLPKMEAAADSMQYTLAVAEMVTHIHDSHGFIRSAVLRTYFGAAPPPIIIRMIEGAPVVTDFFDESAARAAGIEVGDVILKVDGEEANPRIERYAKYIAASTPQALMGAVMARFLTGADSSMIKLTVSDRTKRVKEVRMLRRSAYWNNWQGQRSGDILKMLPGNIGYADLDRLPVPMVDSMFTMFKNTKAIIFDMRGYPKGTAWTIAPRLTEKRDVGAATFHRPIRMSPDLPRGGALSQSITETFVQRLPSTEQWRYKGKTVMLIDERTISQAEYTGLFFEAANGTKFVGSHTTGANGDVTNFYVPGGILIHFTGQSVSHADGRQLQRIGLVPDFEVKPTIKGMRSGKDEVLEKAIAVIGK